MFDFEVLVWCAKQHSGEIPAGFFPKHELFIVVFSVVLFFFLGQVLILQFGGLDSCRIRCVFSFYGAKGQCEMCGLKYQDRKGLGAFVMLTTLTSGWILDLF